MISENILQNLLCPLTKQSLHLAEEELCRQLEEKRAQSSIFRKSGRAIQTEITAGLVTEDSETFYPIVHGIPQLLAPEGISIRQDPQSGLSIEAPQYWEPYEEMTSYDGISSAHLESGEADSALGEITSENMQTLDAERQPFRTRPGCGWMPRVVCWPRKRHTAI